MKCKFCNNEIKLDIIDDSINGGRGMNLEWKRKNYEKNLISGFCSEICKHKNKICCDAEAYGDFTIRKEFIKNHWNHHNKD